MKHLKHPTVNTFLRENVQTLGTGLQACADQPDLSRKTPRAYRALKSKRGGLRGSQMPLSFGRSQETEETNSEWNVSRLSVGGGAAGLIVTLVVIDIAFVGLPPARWFLAAAIPVGVIAAVILRFTARDRE